MTGIEVKGAKELAEMLKQVERKAPGRIEKKLNEIAKEVKADAQEKTPVKTGNLKKNFKIEKAKKIGKEYRAGVYNNSNHAHLAEDGHWHVINRGPRKGERIGWVDGFFMLSKAVEDTNRKIQRELIAWLPTIYEELE